MDRLFGRHGSQGEVETVLYETGRRDPKTDPRPWDGRTSVKVAGESYRQDELVRITGRRGSEALKIENVELELVCEPDNEHDPRAVKVLVQGLHVGYLSKGTLGGTASGSSAKAVVCSSRDSSGARKADHSGCGSISPTIIQSRSRCPNRFLRTSPSELREERRADPGVA